MSLPAASTQSFSPFWDASQAYLTDAWQRSILFADTLHQRGNIYLKQAREDNPPVLIFDYEMLIDGRTLPRPVNYALARIMPPAEYPASDPQKQAFVVIDPRAGQGPGIGGFKLDSEIGIALKQEHPCYFFSFFPHPEPGQTIEDITKAQALFMQKVNERHPDAVNKPFVIGNCQGGWALMLLAALAPEEIGQIMLAGSPLSYWAGVRGKNPMRYAGGMLGGTWTASLASDLGNGRFDGSYLVNNFEYLNPSNTLWTKLYNVYAKVDTEPPRFLDFERWWGGHSLMNKEEMDWITQNLFVGNRLTSGEVAFDNGKTVLDLHDIRVPIVVFASWGDNITPPQQALNWIPDLYGSVEDIRLNGQTIVYCLNDKIGHLGIFVSGSVAKKEHTELIGTLDLVEMLPPGLYQAIIEDTQPDMPGLEYTDGRYLVRFEERTLEDILALDDGRDDEAAFEVVNRVAHVNQHMYDTFVSPWVKAFSNEFTAEAIRLCNPARLERWLWSDLNPATWVLPGLAEMVKTQRQPVDADNPLLKIEQQVSELIEQSLDSYRDQRDATVEQTFEAIYDSSWLPALMGMNKGDTPHANTHNNWMVRELRRLKSAELEQWFEHGSELDGYIRLIALAGLAKRQIDARQFYAIRQVLREKQIGQQAGQLKILKDTVCRQTMLALLNPQRALDGVKKLLPQVEQRRKAVDGLVRLQEICGFEVKPQILEQIQQRLDIPPVTAQPTIGSTPHAQPPAVKTTTGKGRGASATRGKGGKA